MRLRHYQSGVLMGYNRSGRKFKDRIKRRKILERRLAQKSTKAGSAPAASK
jgi:hypothetical protein